MQTEWSPGRNDEHRSDDAVPAPDQPPGAGGWDAAEPVVDDGGRGAVPPTDDRMPATGDVTGDVSAVGDGSDVPSGAASPSVDGQEGEEEAHRSAVDAVDELLDEVELALARLDDGTYGRCETCGSPIDDTDLAAHPLAAWVPTVQFGRPRPRGRLTGQVRIRPVAPVSGSGQWA